MTLHFFSEDGQYGSASGLVVINTADWSEADWEAIDDVSDWQRPAVAYAIHERKKATVTLVDAMTHDVS